MYKLHLIFFILRKITFDYLPFRKSKKSLLIVIYHQVNNDTKLFYPSVPTSVFYKTCLFLKKHYELIHVNEIESYFNSNNRKPAAIITFDDGLHDIKANVVDFCTKNKIKISLNIDTEILETGKPQDFMRIYDVLNTTGFEGNYFDEGLMSEPIVIDRTKPYEVEVNFTQILTNLNVQDRRVFVNRFATYAGMSERDYTHVLTKEDIREFSKSPLIEFGSHSHTHPILSTIDQISLVQELQLSKQHLEALTSKPITIIAYPNGLSNENVRKTAISLGYTKLLHSNNTSNHIQNLEYDYDRINQYHTNFEVGIANMYGVLTLIKRLIKR
jgi:peptidoglycan/xylan/chitin deacetylase (PgdA/CDA1 family)